jgi:hypothetical protein
MKSVKRLRSLTLFLSLLLVFGCNSNAKNNQINFDIIASEKTLPIHFNEIAFEEQYLVRKLVNQSEFEDTWNLYAFESKTPNVDLKEKDVFFIGVHESGSCPYKIRNIKRNSDNKTITVPLSEPNGACTSDATPRTFVIQIDKEKSKDIESVVIVQNGVETSVPLKN